MVQAIWNGKVIADSEHVELLEGNAYFPPDSIHQDCFRPNQATTVCGWKGTANYYDIVVDDQVNKQAAWYYVDPKPEAARIRGHVAFWKGVVVK